MTVYIDNDYKCSTEATEGLRAFETYFFEGKCKAFIEGHRYIPFGESWTRSDGEVFEGEMISPWKNSAVLAAYQEQYEEMLAEVQIREAALAELGVKADD